MARRLSVTVERFPLATAFVISRGAKTEAAVVVCRIEDGEACGHGECVPYARYGESLESVQEAIEAIASAIGDGASRAEVQTLMPPGAARNAVDCALWDLEAKQQHRPVAEIVCDRPARPLETAYTISLGSPAEMAEAARAAADRRLLKIKVGGDNDIERIRAVHAASNGARLILDANEGWTQDNVRQNLMAAAAAGVVLVEQPLPAGRDAMLAEIPHPVPICADESLHVAADVDGLVGRYDFVNVKLDKTGGLTEAVALLRAARRNGFGVMVGCMVGSSLSMAPAVLLAQHADIVDLDGPLLLRHDRPHGLTYSRSTVSPPSPALWG
ncbi:N-acetyl-D-Glu racemase DgcA [Mangrovibrevibacter kandeliae]|uniref:N-acetyl-D-Glu racemase DgcA n=1 Tax=Mangrovibrevibacter kandeliae TaxID=2968473 RepID=UPI002117AC6D|nr:N-acetyl-D-Glu racemase DgcA [Aurantimonas sp. CSK15Z-1]MCQ8782797.1 dipeptide epimerase [Aurantimonas sp. CSK15Z-1]